MPPGPIYNGQGQPQRQQHPQYNHAQYQHQLQNQQSQSRSPHPIHPQYSASYANNAPQQYQQVQYPHYPPQQQQQPVFYPSSAPQFQNYNAATFNHARPPTAASPVQFVDPSYLRRPVAPAQTAYASPTPTPAAAPAPAPAPTSRAAAVAQAVPAIATPQPPRVAQNPLQTPVARDSPNLHERRPPSQGAMGKSTPKDARRLTSGAVAKSPVLTQTPRIENLPLLLSVAEDCFAKANAAAPNASWSMGKNEVGEHHKLVATGLGCLEVAMKLNKLTPRLEARLCLRYAGVLVDETTNIMEAETALTRGIAVCEKHNFTDLQYSSQFLLMKTLFQRNPKAAFRSLDAHISDCTTYKHIHWIYAFRFLKAAFYVQAGTPADHHAVENLRKIAGIANQREDKAIFIMAMLLEGLAHLSALKDDWRTRVQACIAQAAKLQLDEAAHLPHLDILLSLLDLACSLHTRDADMSKMKLTTLQTKLDDFKKSPGWNTMSDEIFLPIKRMPNTASTISNDTRAIIRLGTDNITDYLVLCTIGKHEVYALAYMFQGMVALQTATTPRKSTTLWNEAKKVLEDNQNSLSPRPLPEALRQKDWVNKLVCYINILIGLQAATFSDWAGVKKCLEAIHDAQPPEGLLDIMTLYLDGVLKQGTADVKAALDIWRDPSFDISKTAKPKRSHIETELSILAALNRIWALHEEYYRDDAEVADLVAQLRPHCEDSPDPDIKTAYAIVMSSIRTDPSHLNISMQELKAHLQSALNNARSTKNVQCLSMGLNIMRFRLFSNHVGDQALKSAKAALVQATKSGNILWISVAEGMLAQSHLMMDQLAESKKAQEAGIRHANEAFHRTQV